MRFANTCELCHMLLLPRSFGVRQQAESGLMDDGLGKIEIFPDHFVVSTPPKDCPQNQNSTSSQAGADYSSRSCTHSWSGRKLMNLFSPRGLPWRSSSDDDKVTLTVAKLESLRSEIAGVEESEAHLKARLEHVDEILRSARLAGYLCIRTRWTPLPGEPHIDDSDVDDWLPRFVVLYGSCMFFYFQSTGSSEEKNLACPLDWTHKINGFDY